MTNTYFSSIYPVTFIPENESHMHAVSSTETNTAESGPRLHQSAEDDEEVQYF